MLLEYAAIAIFIIVAVAIGFIAIGLGQFLGPQKKTSIKAMPYESGMDPIGPGTRRLPVGGWL